MSLTTASIPLLGFAAYSGTGKTTLLEKLLPKLNEMGLKVAVIKHAHHNFDIDQEGKDSYRLRKAGASQMLISSRFRNALITETPDEETTCQQLINKLDQTELDLILIEGFKQLPYTKIELHRDEVGKPWIFPEDNNIIAIASDSKAESELPQMDINDTDAITAFIVDYVKQHQHKQQSDLSANCDELSPAFLSVSQGRAKILEAITPLDSQSDVSLVESINALAAQDILSPINVPQHNNSAMDGYVICGDVIERESYTVVAEIMAGHSYDHPLQHGEAAKIMTGAPVPENGNTVIMREQATQEGNQVRFDAGKSGIRKGQNVRLAGEDLAIDQICVAKGSRITAPEVGMLASLGIASIPVISKTKVAIFSTGDEVQAPGEAQKPNSIYDSNRFTLTALLQKIGCEVIDFGIIEDSEAALESTLSQASQQADMILSSGGVSVGDADYIKTILDKLGNINFWRINMRPGRPLAFGHIGDTPFFGLPGNPVAVMVAFLQFVEPALRKLQGEDDWKPETFTAIAKEFIRSRTGRTEYSRGIYSINQNGQMEVVTTGKQGSGILRSMSEANCLIEVQPDVESVDIGQKVTIIPLGSRV